MRRSNLALCVTAACLAFATRGTAQSSKASIERGKTLYEANCLACHQVDGGGVPRMNPSLIGSTVVAGDKTQLIGNILNGLSNQPVDGKNYSNVMPAMQYLSDAEIADVLTYVRNSFTNEAPAVTAAEVKKVRASK